MSDKLVILVLVESSVTPVVISSPANPTTPLKSTFPVPAFTTRLSAPETV